MHGATLIRNLPHPTISGFGHPGDYLQGKHSLGFWASAQRRKRLVHPEYVRLSDVRRSPQPARLNQRLSAVTQGAPGRPSFETQSVFEPFPAPSARKPAWKAPAPRASTTSSEIPRSSDRQTGSAISRSERAATESPAQLVCARPV